MNASRKKIEKVADKKKAMAKKMGDKYSPRHVTDLTPDRSNPARKKYLEDKFRKMGSD